MYDVSLRAKNYYTLSVTHDIAFFFFFFALNNQQFGRLASKQHNKFSKILIQLSFPKCELQS